MARSISIPIPDEEEAVRLAEAAEGVARLAEAAARAERNREPVVLTRAGQPVLVLMPVEELQRLEDIASRFRRIQQRLQSLRESDIDEIESEFDDADDEAAVRAARARWASGGREQLVSLEEFAAKHAIDLSSPEE